MLGPEIYARTIKENSLTDKHGNTWQYHSRSDSHSKAACWAIMFDLLQHCTLLAQHARESNVGFGINHEMHDFRMNRKKNLDLVVCTPGGDGFVAFGLDELSRKYGISLTDLDRQTLRALPSIRKCPVGTTLLALEAKACMTEHSKARPRLYDELSSSFQTIHGDTNSAIAAALVTINISRQFISPDRNKYDLSMFPVQVNEHKQPYVSQKVLEKVRQLPRRSNTDESGYDAIGVVLLDFRNDGSEVEVSADFGDGTGVDKILTYQSMIERISHIYSIRFKSL